MMHLPDMPDEVARLRVALLRIQDVTGQEFSTPEATLRAVNEAYFVAGAALQDGNASELQRMAEGVWARFWELGNSERQKELMRFFDQMLDLLES